MTHELQKKILLVEDDVLIAMTEKKALEGYNYQVTTAHTGEKAIKAVKNESFDLVLMDINLGSGMDGTEVAQKILTIDDLPIVFLSSHTEKAIVEKSEKITSYGYVVKNTGIIVLDASIKMAFKLFEEKGKTEMQRLHLNTTLNSIGDAVITTDPEGHIIRMNPVAESLTGWLAKEAEGTLISHVFKVIDADTRQPIEDAVQTILDRKGVQKIATNKILVNRQGYEYQIYDSGNPIQDDKGRTSGVVLVFRDMTEHYNIQKEKTVYENQIKRKPEEEALQIEIKRDITGRSECEPAQTEGENKIRSITQNASDLLFIKDKFRRFTFMNQALANLLGLPESQILGKTAEEVFGTGQNVVMKGLDDKAFCGETVTETRKFYINKQARFFNCTQTPLSWDAGKVVSILGIIRDLTDPTLTQYQLEAIYKTASYMMCIADLNTATFIKVNPAFCLVLGYNEQELLERPFFSFIHPDDIEVTNAIIEKDLKAGKNVSNFANRYRTKNGEYRWFDWIGHSVPEDGVAYAIVRDITESKQSQERIHSLLKEKELLLQEVHHRIKNNMTVIKGLLSLQAGNVEEISAKEALGTAEKRLTSMMLLYDKIYRSKQKDEICIKDYLSSLVDEILLTYTIRVEVIKKMVSVVVPVHIASPLGIIVNELISNTMKYAFEERNENRLEISVANKGSQFILIVQDNGKGFDSTTSSKGFGLELVRNLSDQIDGNLTIENNNGTKCRLEFDIEEQEYTS